MIKSEDFSYGLLIILVSLFLLFIYYARIIDKREIYILEKRKKYIDNNLDKSEKKKIENVVKLMKVEEEEKLTGKLIKSSLRGAIRGTLMGGISSGLPGALTGGTILAVVNPIMIYFD